MPRFRVLVGVLVALGVLAFAAAAQQARAQEADSTAPVFVSARTDTNGENIIITFSEAVTINPAATLVSDLHNVPVLDLIRGVLSVTIDGREDLLSGAAVQGSELTIRVTAPRIEAGQAVSIASDTVFARSFVPLLVDADGNPVPLFPSQSVQNLSVIPRGTRVAAGPVVSSNFLRIAEGQSERYTVRLPSQPPGDVTVELFVWRLGAIRVEPHQMTFTSSNWNVPQAATVITDSDDDAQDIWTVILHTRSDASLGRAAAIVRVIVDDENELLRVSGSSTPEYTENATTTVATYAAPWTSGVAWSLFGADRDHFSINREGDLSFVAPPDYEDPADADADNVYQVAVHASDGSASGFLGVSVTVTDLNEPPDVFGPVGVGFEEGSGTLVGAYTYDDPEDGAATWSLAGSDHHHFTVTNGELRFREAPDFESPADANGNNRYEVTVLAEDGGDLPGKRRATVSVIDVNEEPSIDGPANVAYAENGTGAVATFTATDPEQHTILWSLSGADADDFTIAGGALRFVEAPDYESRAGAGGNSAYRLTVHASDGATATQAVTVTLTDEDETGALVLSSGQPQVGALLAATHTDADGIVSESWSWERSTNRSDWSAIAGATTNRYTPTSADLGYYVRVTVQYGDGHGPGKRRSSVSDRRVRARPATNRAPEFPSPAAARSLPENAGPGTSVGARVAATDADRDLLRYSLSGPGAEAFVIDGATGAIRVAPGRLLNHEAQSSHSVTVTVTDPSNARATATVTIAIEDVNEAPTAVGDTASTDEGEAASIDVLHNDADPEGDLLRVSLESAPEGGAATVKAGGAITYTPRPDHHGPDAFTYSISDGEHSATATVIVNVRAVNHAPAFPTASTVRVVDSRAAARTRVGPPVAAIDQDGDQVTYRLSGRAARAFDIDEHTGQLRLRAGTMLDPAQQDSYGATVTATDPSGATASINVTITVTEPPRSRSGGPSRPSSDVDFEWTVEHDLDELDAHNEWPTGLWSNGTTLWITEAGPDSDGGVYAYDLASGERRERAEFDLDERNRAPRGLSSDRETAWISNHDRNRLYAYDLSSGERAEHRDIVLDARNSDAHGLWSDGDETVWVVDGERATLFAYDLRSGDFLADYRLGFGNDDPRGVWSDGVTVWVSDDGAKRLFAYRLPVPRQAGSTRLRRVEEEDFGELFLSQASNNSPRGIWSDGGVMYVADEHDGRVYSYNMPDAIDARLTSLTLSDIDIGEFSPIRREYAAVAPTGVTETTVDAHVEQPGTSVAIAPADSDARASGYQVAIADGVEVTVTVTSSDGSRRGVYRVRIAPGPPTPCLRGAVAVGFSLLTYAGGSVEELVSCAADRHITVLYTTRDGTLVSYILGAPDLVNRTFREFYADGVPINTPLLAKSDGPASPDTSEGDTQP